MSKSDWAFLALNAVLLFWAFVGFASTDFDTLMVGAMVAMAVSVANGIRIVRNRDRENREPRRVRSRRRRSDRDDEMDARTVLELDARLEALERRERDLDEAERIRRLADLGEQSVPADPVGSARLGTEADRERV
ncbi:MAG: hypothetical protein AAGI52_12370 [Bacteroidota bacterium]